MIEVPPGPAGICQRLRDAGHAAYIVGGAVRDRLLGRTPGDWDVLTDARPQRVQELFAGAGVEDRDFGRVLVGETDVMTMRCDGVYRDGRRPSSVTFCADIEADLARRDFTINALAYDPSQDRIIDPYGGLSDLRLRVLRVVGDARDRFAEDHLRMLRAVRVRAVLGFSLDAQVAAALIEGGHRLALVSSERMRDELSVILVSDGVKTAFADLLAYGLLASVLPELEPCTGHARREDDLYHHLVLTAHYIERSLGLRLAGLLHDAGKPDRPGPGHETASAAMARAALERLRYPRALVDRVTRLIDHHMFLYPEGTPPGSMRRLVLELGAAGVEDLLELRRADRQASGRKGLGLHGERALGHLRQVVREGSALSLQDLAVDGHDLRAELGLGEGPRIGRLLHQLHELVLDDPGANTRETLLVLARQLTGGNR